MKKLSLTGRKILITRARDQASQFSVRLRRLGAEVTEFPTIEIVPPLSWESVDRSIDRLHSYDWVIFTSANGADFFWRRMKEKGKAFPHRSPKVAAIGPATAESLKRRGLRAAYTPKEFVAEGILRGFEEMGIEGKRILLARARKARDVLPEGLRRKGALVDVVETYRTVKPKGGSRRLRQLLEKGGLDVITFTSSSTVSHFVELLKGTDLKGLLGKITIACIGPITAKTASDFGMSVRIQPEEYTIPALAEAIAIHFEKRIPVRKDGAF